MTEAPTPVRVELVPGEDPHIYDAVTGEEITSRVRSLMLFPNRDGVVTLLRLRDGHPYIVGDELAVDERDIASMSGTWENRRGARPEAAA